ncbi:MAG: thiamine biosynthesis protein ThiJ [Hyphomicrobiales bacterium]|nr:MAG: thiamine biosynthesis protein ThiJ [Hyphomicrobiales bacterium]
MKILISLLLLLISQTVQAETKQPMHNMNSHDMKMDHIAKSATNTKQINIAVLIYDGVVLQDFTGPIEVFSKAKRLTKGKYNLFTIAQDDEAISTENGFLKVTPDYSFSNMPEADYLIIPGGSMPVVNEMMKKQNIIDFIKAYDKKHTKIVSICTGSYLLANTGLLQGKKATTHYFVADDFSKLFDDIEIIKDVRFVDEGQYITSSGVTSGIDTALYIVGQNSGVNIQNMISRALQYTFHEKETWPVAPNGMKYRR